MPRHSPSKRARTAWHPLLVLLLEHELPRASFQIWPEFVLTREPQRIDVVVVRRRPHGRSKRPELLTSLVGDLREHTLVHFKGPTDDLGRDDPVALLAYACQYQVVTEVWNPARIELRVVANRLTPRFASQLRLLGGRLAQEEAGVWVGTLGPFDLRVVETAVRWHQRGERVMYAFSRGFVKDPLGAGHLEAREQALYQFLAQQVEQLSRQGALKMLKQKDKLTKSFHRFVLEDFLPTCTIEERFYGVDDAEILKVLLRRLPKDVASDVATALKSHRPRRPSPRKH